MSQLGQFGFEDDLISLTGDAGGAVGSDGLNNINLNGGIGITVTGTPLTNSLSIDATGLPGWTREAGAAIAAVAGHGYINTNVGLTTITLPAVAALGTVIAIMGESAALWTIAQNAGQNIQYGSLSTTVGIGGSVDATNRYDTVYIVCRVADLTWQVTSVVGILNVL